MKPLGRRDEIIDATWALIGRVGLEKTTLRAVAREMACTTGVVSHHFIDKDELILAVVEKLLGALDERFAAVLQEGESLERLRDACLTLLPIDRETQSMWRVWTTFLGISTGRARLAGSHEQRYNEYRTGFAERIGRLQSLGQVTGSQSAEALGAGLLALIDGLGVSYIITPERFTPDIQTACLDAHFELLTARSVG